MALSFALDAEELERRLRLPGAKMGPDTLPELSPSARDSQPVGAPGPRRGRH